MASDNIDEVDRILAKMDGKIVRKAEDAMRCQHGSNQKCTHCLPLDPYDEGYLREKDIKHLSFHAYVRKLTNLHGKGTHSKFVVENVDLKLKQNCPAGHPPYPRGLCTKCRPSTLTLNRQVFRHVDNIEFENGNIVNNFLNFWRRSSHQRLGYLIGRYDPFTDVPLGIKAVVCSIYEPPQHSSDKSIGFDPDPNEQKVDELCGWLGLKRVGWMFSDLWTDNAKIGTVQCIRNEESFLLAASECITAGDLQSKFKNYTEYCSDGYFGSKFVTVVASGNKQKQIDFTGYQVSNQCMAMVEANILCPTKKSPELAWVREKPLTPSHYITDVQYTEKDEHGAEVKRDGRPMPVEYLLVDVPCGVPKQPNHTFQLPKKEANAFPIENRALVGEGQELEDLKKYMSDYTLPNEFLQMASNFHFLLFIHTNKFVEFAAEEVEELAGIVCAGDADRAKKWAHENPHWGTLTMLIELSYN